MKLASLFLVASTALAAAQVKPETTMHVRTTFFGVKDAQEYALSAQQFADGKDGFKSVLIVSCDTRGHEYSAILNHMQEGHKQFKDLFLEIAGVKAGIPPHLRVGVYGQSKEGQIIVLYEHGKEELERAKLAMQPMRVLAGDLELMPLTAEKAASLATVKGAALCKPQFDI